MTGQIGEQQVIHYLKQMRVALLKEIKSIDQTIKGITDTHLNQRWPLVDQQPIYRDTRTHVSKKKLSPTEKFDPTAKLDCKISFALTNVGQGFKEDILDILQKAQPNLDAYKLKKVLAVRLSYLLKNGLIDGRKIGRRYEYALFED